MARTRLRPRSGYVEYNAKTGSANGGIIDNGVKVAAAVPGAALTITDDGEVGLAGENDLVIAAIDHVDVQSGKVRVIKDFRWDMIAGAAITAGVRVMGASDTDRGRIIAATAAQAHNASSFVTRTAASAAGDVIEVEAA